MKNFRNWYKIDNAGKMFQVLHKPFCDCVYRIAVNLKEDVQPTELEQAVNDLKMRFPTFFVKVKSGFFWYYFEENFKRFQVKRETAFINQYIDPKKNNGFMFAVYYYNNRISLECLHSLSDGYGALEFIKSIVFRYLQLVGKEVEDNNLIRLFVDEVNLLEFEDSYKKYYNPKLKLKKIKLDKAFHVKGEKLDKRKGYGLIYGKMDSSSLLALARKNNSSITEYITALYVYSVWKVYKREVKKSKKPIVPNIPVNLRGIFPSCTMRNFSLVFYCPFYETEKLTFKNILEKTKIHFKKGTQKEYLQFFLNSNIKIEKSWLVRFLPLFLKNIVISAGKKIIGDSTFTHCISNLGVVKMPPSMAKHIIDFECSNTNGVSIMSANNIATISFNRIIKETKIEQFFFSYLAKQGIKIEIQSNLKEDLN